MNQKPGNEPPNALWIVVAIVVFIALVGWYFSTLFGVDYSSASRFVAGLGACVLLTGLSLWFGRDYKEIRFGAAWPVLLAIFWLAWWPVLDYWAGKRPRLSSPTDDPMPSFARVPVWLGEWYTQWGVLVAIIVIGVAVNRLRDRE